MAEPTDITTESRKFMKLLKELKLPEGDVKYQISESLQEESGASPVFNGLAAFIDHHADSAYQAGGNQEIIDRLEGRGADGKKDPLASLSSRIANVAIGGDKSAETVLLATLKIRDEDLFERLLTAIEGIADDKKAELSDNRDDGSSRSHDDDASSRSWRQSIAGDGPKVDDDAISREAKEHDDETGSGKIEDVVRGSLDTGALDNAVNAAKSDYERNEERGVDKEYFHQAFSEKREINAYYNLLLQVKTAYDSTIGKAISQQADKGAARG